MCSFYKHFKTILMKCIFFVSLLYFFFSFDNKFKCIGNALGCAAIGVILGFICAAMSIKAESGNMNINVKRRIEAGERLLCVM